MLRVDLHIHSLFSDGTLSPENLVLLAKKRKISVLSLADHDSAEGVERFLACCKKANIKGVSGIELSAEYSKTLHILGYRFDVPSLSGNGLIELIKAGREERNITICKKLQEIGIDISISEVTAEAGEKNGVVARPHIARVLVKKGYAQNISNAFSKYLVRGAQAYADRFRISAKDCISLIRRAGGLPVIAHPGQTAGRNSSVYELKPLIAELKEFGLWGIECYTLSHNSAQIYESLKLAKEFGLYATAGSDFHGDNRPGCEIGVAVKDDILPWARFCGGL